MTRSGTRITYLNDVYAADDAEHPVTLFINDYGTEQAGKRSRYKALVERMIQQGGSL